MKRIQLTDGSPTNVQPLKSSTINLATVIKAECKKNGLSYVEINKALHVADEELYKEAINKKFN